VSFISVLEENNPPTKISEAFFFPSKSFHKSKRPRAELEIGMCHNDALPEYPSTSIKTLLQVERVGLVSQSASRRQGPSLVQQLPTDCNNCEEKRVLSSRVCVCAYVYLECMVNSMYDRFVTSQSGYSSITNEEAS
jgi:hypothetical protein